MNWDSKEGKSKTVDKKTGVNSKTIEDPFKGATIAKIFTLADVRETLKPKK